MKRKSLSPPKPVRSSAVPATVGMLHEMESRLGHKIDGGLLSIRGEMSQMRSELKTEIGSLREDLKAEIHRLGLLMEEQNARNVFVLDGYAQLYALIERKLG